MNIIKNLPALTKILASLPGLHTYKKQMDRARAAGEPEAERAAIRAAETKWGNYLMDKFKVDLQVEGKENLPKEGPVVYVSNHQGFVDIPALCAALDTVQFGFGVALAGVPTIQLRILRLEMIGVALLIVSVTVTSSSPPEDHSKPSTSLTLAL